MTSKEDIAEWKREGKRLKAKLLIVVCDTFSYEDYPVYCNSRSEYKPGTMQSIMEIYEL